MSDTKTGADFRLSLKYITIATAVAALVGTNAGQAGAETISSSCTSTAPKHCRMIGTPGAEDGSSTRVCRGKSVRALESSPRITQLAIC
jgi:hypothetical protein